MSFELLELPAMSAAKIERLQQVRMGIWHDL